MNKEEKNLGSILIFIFVIALIAFGGYYLINNNEEVKLDDNTNEKKSIKIDEDKDYIYFTNEESLSKKESLIYKDINININTDDAKKLQDELNNNMKNIKGEVSKISDQKELNISADLLQDDIYEAKMIDYEEIKSDKYITLSVNTYTYKYDEGAINSNLKFYVFDILDGKLLTNRDILSKENISDQQVRTKIRDYIKNDDSVDIDATLARDYTLTVSKDNKIIINTIVKSLDNEYMIDIEM